ncbi:MAG: peptidase T [Clostridiales bacterium]|jgi:tripeptide aminopeptidase|nr:peptidase T [Clostridiales bacterium]
MDILKNVSERFIKYAKIDTQSIEDSNTFPSTLKQLDLARLLFAECEEIGLCDIRLDDYGYVTATLPADNHSEIPVVGFIAHYDTSPDASDTGVLPKIIKNYDGNDIHPSHDINISPIEFPELKNYIGQDIITASGNTLLGADDKAGIAEILTALEYLKENPDIKRGNIRICFTPDEEVGHGADHFDVPGFGAAFAYTVDGGELGELEGESFNAALARIDITGKSVHPGYAKDVMVNAALLAAELVNLLPAEESPANTQGYEGFYHVTNISGTVEHAQVKIIIRDFDRNNFHNRKSFIRGTVEQLNADYDNAFCLEIVNQYFNMAEPLEKFPHILEIAKQAMTEAGIRPAIKPIRGGTDGCRLSYMGLPCPNIFTGGHNFHGPYEYIPIQSMGKAVETIVNICKLVAD